MYKLCFWQKSSKNLVYAARLENVVVKMLSNNHGVISLDGEYGMMLRGEEQEWIKRDVAEGCAVSGGDKRVL